MCIRTAQAWIAVFQVLDTVMWDTTSEANVNLFTAYGQDIVHLGSTFSRWGGFVGIPVNFQYQSTEDVEREKITLNNQTIDWSSPAGRQLVDAMVLSERARQYAIARELFYLRTYHAHIQGLLVGVSFFMAYWMGAAANALYGLRRRLPTGSRVVVYSFFGGIGATFYCFASDSYTSYRDRKVDRKAAELGLEYAQGGVEFYNKLLQRNMALRVLMGPDGGKRYTAYGNDIHFWRSPNMPLTSRRDAVAEMARSLRESASQQESVVAAASSQVSMDEVVKAA